MKKKEIIICNHKLFRWICKYNNKGKCTHHLQCEKYHIAELLSAILGSVTAFNPNSSLLLSVILLFIPFFIVLFKGCKTSVNVEILFFLKPHFFAF